MDDAPLHMWRYWRDDYGPVEALKKYYSNLLRTDVTLAHAVNAIDLALLAINSKMERMAADAEPEN